MVQGGDTLGIIAQRYGVSLEQLTDANQLANPNLLEVGQTLTISVATPQGLAPAFKIIPNSELVNGPASIGFDTEGFIRTRGGFLAQYTEEVDEKTLTGAQIVDRIAQDYSVSPRLLLAVLQYQSGWLDRTDIKEGKKDFPMGVRVSGAKACTGSWPGQPITSTGVIICGEPTPRPPGCWAMAVSPRWIQPLMPEQPACRPCLPF